MKESDKQNSDHLKEKKKESSEVKTEKSEKKKTPIKKPAGKTEKLEEIIRLHKDEIDKFKKEIETKEKDAKENNDKWLRLNAEFDNFKKRMQREKHDFFKYAGEKIIRDFLPFIDDLERAVKAAKIDHKVEDFIKGVEIIMNQIKSSLESSGVKQIDSLSQPFDPNKHEAVSKIPTTDHKNNTVIEELRKGYMFFDRLLRAAMVVVAENTSSDKKTKKTEMKVENEDKKDETGKEKTEAANKDISIKDEVVN